MFTSTHCQVKLSPCIRAGLRKARDKMKYVTTERATFQSAQHDRPTYIREVACHPTPPAVLVPYWRLFTRSEAMGGTSTDDAGAGGARPLNVAVDPTKHTDWTFLKTQKC